MQVHLPHETNWQPWARGIAIVLALLAAPIALAVTWLAVVRGLL
jgi:hypothetical protein